MVSESLCRTGKTHRATGLKGKVVWPGGSRRHPTGDQDSLCWIGKDRKVSCVAGRLSPTSEGRKILAVWMGKSRWPWGGKGKVAGREALAGVRWEIKTHCQTGKDGKVKLGGREALAVT